MEFKQLKYFYTYTQYFFLDEIFGWIWIRPQFIYKCWFIIVSLVDFFFLFYKSKYTLTLAFKQCSTDTKEPKVWQQIPHHYHPDPNPGPHSVHTKFWP